MTDTDNYLVWSHPPFIINSHAKSWFHPILKPGIRFGSKKNQWRFRIPPTNQGDHQTTRVVFFFLQSFHPALTFIPGWKKAHWGDDPRCSQGPWLSPMFQISQISWFQELLIVPDSSRIPGLNIQYCSRYPDFIAYPLLVPAEFERSPNFLPRRAELSDVPTSFPSNHSKCQSCRECSNSKFVVRWFRNQCEDLSSQVPQINSGLSPWLVCEHPKQNWKGKTQTACCT